MKDVLTLIFMFAVAAGLILVLAVLSPLQAQVIGDYGQVIGGNTTSSTVLMNGVYYDIPRDQDRRDQIGHTFRIDSGNTTSTTIQWQDGTYSDYDRRDWR